MAEFLSDAWVAALDETARAASPPPDLRVVVQEVVVGDDGAEVAYAIRIADGCASVVPGRAADADITLTQDRTTAARIARGDLSAQVAFMAGHLRVGGDLRAVMDRARAIATLGDVFAAARNGTAW